jgi:hypothetical protein
VRSGDGSRVMKRRELGLCAAWAAAEDSANDRWIQVTHALGGLFCAGLGPSEHATSVNTFGDIFPPIRGEPSGEPFSFLRLAH